MATLTYNGEAYTVDHAAKGADYIHGYDADGVLVVAFDGVTDFSYFTYDGDYMSPSDCLPERCNDMVYCGGLAKTRSGASVPPSALGFSYGSDEPTETPDTGEGSVYFRTGGDAVVEVGTSGIWTYRKWASGIAECWGSKTYTAAIASTSGSNYYVKLEDPEDYPFTFAAVPQQFATLQSGPYAAWLEINASSASWPSTTSTGAQMLVSTVKRDSGEYTVAYHVIGRWK